MDRGEVVGNAVRTKVVDMANVTGAFYTNLMPEADAFKLLGKPMSEQRKNGTWAYVNELHNKKLNSHYLARQFYNVPFHIYLNKKPAKFDFTGLKIRVTPVYRDIVTAYGGAAITTALLSFPERLGPVQDQGARTQADVERDGLDPVLATIIRLAIDGLWLSENFNLMRFDPDMKAKVAARLLEWTRNEPE